MKCHRKPGKEQYSDAGKFNARIYLNSKFSTNKYPWPAWIFDQFIKLEKCKVLELGCGTGLLWQLNADCIPATWQITFSDYSQGMLDETQKNLVNIKSKVDFMVIDAVDIKLPDESFDIVIANNMLYHINDRRKALSEIKRVLKGEGTFYATTASTRNLQELRCLLKEFKGSQVSDTSFEAAVSGFSLENGKEQLRKYFREIEMRQYNNSLEITEADSIVNYFLSLNGIYDGEIVLEEGNIDSFRKFISNKLECDSKIHVTKDSGMFICKK